MTLCGGAMHLVNSTFTIRRIGFYCTSKRTIWMGLPSLHPHYKESYTFHFADTMVLIHIWCWNELTRRRYLYLSNLETWQSQPRRRVQMGGAENFDGSQ